MQENVFVVFRFQLSDMCNKRVKLVLHVRLRLKIGVVVMV